MNFLFGRESGFFGSFFRRESYVLVIGDSGVGKTSFINTFLDSKKGKEGHDQNSCTQGISLYKGTNGVTYIDTQGTNDTIEDDNKAVLSIVLKEFLKENISQLSGIVYLQDAGNARDYTEIRLRYWSKIFSLPNLSQSAILLLTKYNDYGSNKQKRIQEEVSSYKSKVSNVILWDSKDPLPDQMKILEESLKRLKCIDLTVLRELISQAHDLARELNEKDKKQIRVVREKPRNFTQTFDFCHIEESSGPGVVSFLTLGLSKAFTIKSTEHFSVYPSYTPGSISRRITGVDVGKVQSFDVFSWSWKFNGINNENGSLQSKMKASSTRFGQSIIKYNVQVYLSETNHEVEYEYRYNHSVSYHLEVAKTQVLLQKLRNT